MRNESKIAIAVCRQQNNLVLQVREIKLRNIRQCNPICRGQIKVLLQKNAAEGLIQEKARLLFVVASLNWDLGVACKV